MSSCLSVGRSIWSGKICWRINWLWGCVLSSLLLPRIYDTVSYAENEPWYIRTYVLTLYVFFFVLWIPTNYFLTHIEEKKETIPLFHLSLSLSLSLSIYLSLSLSSYLSFFFHLYTHTRTRSRAPGRAVWRMVYVLYLGSPSFQPTPFEKQVLRSASKGEVSITYSEGGSKYNLLRRGK